jgi:cobalt/nickel transport system permease protein
MQSILHERYQDGDSRIHRLDPRVKVVVALILIAGITLTPARAGWAYPLLWGLVVMLIAAGQLRVGRVARQATLALPFALAAVTLLFTTPGDPLVTVAGLTITGAGVIRFAAILAKSWLAVQVALVLAMTTPFTDLLWALSQLRVPGTLIAITSFMYRYLFTLLDEAERLIRARASRSGSLVGRQSGGSLLWRARIAGGMIGNLFLRSYERSERVYAAMLSRGYAGQLRALDPPPLRWRDAAQGAIPVILLIIVELASVLWVRRG